MKSRWTTYSLLIAVVAVWGVVAWKIITPRTSVVQPYSSVPEIVRANKSNKETLQLNYSDPFLKRVSEPVGETRRTVRQLPPKPKTAKRTPFPVTSIGYVAAGNERLFIVNMKERQYELQLGDTLAGYIFSGYDADSLYFECKQGDYRKGIKRCE